MSLRRGNGSETKVHSVAPPGCLFTFFGLHIFRYASDVLYLKYISKIFYSVCSFQGTVCMFTQLSSLAFAKIREPPRTKLDLRLPACSR